MSTKSQEILANFKKSDGILTRISANRFIAVFIIKNVQYTFHATFKIKGTQPVALPPFTSGKATVIYDNVGNLMDVRSYKGAVNARKFELEFDNKVSIAGDFGEEVAPSAAEIEGLGAWEQN